MLKQILQRLKTRKLDHCTAVIVAAGSSSRMKGEDKLLLPLFGRTVIDRTVEAFQNCAMIDEIVIVTREDLLGYMRSLCAARAYNKVSAIVKGGETRVHSVMYGLDHVSEKTGLVAIHDGARPLVTQDVIQSAICGAVDFHAAAPAIPVKDTVKTAKNRMVTGTPERASLYAVQTPQVFAYDLLRGALQKALQEELPITDDCSAVEALGMSVYLSKGSEENLKITTPVDILLAEAILKGRDTP